MISSDLKWFRVHLLAFIAMLSATPIQADHYKVLLLGGQSNMVGTGADTSGLPTALQSPQADVLFYYSSSLTTLRPGSGQNFGPEVTFGRTIADAFPSDHFGLIKYAVSGSAIHETWDPDPALGTVYNSFRTKVADGLAALTSAGHTYEIVGMLWTQGERDSRIGRTTAQYEFDLNELITDIRTRYGANLPFFLNRLSVGQTDLPDIGPVRTAQENVAAADPFTYLIDADGMSFHDGLHFDAAGQIALGEAFGQAYINSIAPDETAPEVSTLTPGDGSLEVDPWTNLTITFNEQVVFDTGKIYLRQTGGTLVEEFDVASPPSNLSLSGNTITIDPTNILAGSTGHYLEIDATAIDDLSGNSFAGFSGDGTWSFTTAASDVSPPAINSVSPANTTTGVDVNTDLVITFNENVTLGSGNITLRQSGGALIESFDVASPPPNLSLSGAAITLNPTSDLAASTSYYVEIDATAIDDPSGNSFAGISGDGTWSFTTAAGSVSTAVSFGSGVTGTSVEVNSTNTEAYSGDQSSTDLLNGLTPTFDTNWFSTNDRTPANLVDGLHGAGGDVGSLAQPETPPAVVVFDLGTGNHGLGYDLTSLVSIASWGGVGFGNQVWTLEVAGVGDDGNLTSTDFSTLVSADYRPLGSGAGSTKVSVTGLSGALTSGVQYVRITGEVNPDGNSGRFTWREFDIFGTSSSGGNDYIAWIDGFGLAAADKDFNDDPDGDNLSNGIEAWFGTHPGQFNQGLANVSSSGLTTIFTHPQNTSVPSDLTGYYEWSPNLTDWYGSGEGPGSGETVTFSSNTTENTTTVTATASGVVDKLFLRAVVEQK